MLKTYDQDKLQDELMDIFKHYKEEFKLKTTLFFNLEHEKTCYRWGKDGYINISTEEVEDTYFMDWDHDRHDYNNLRELAIIFILHEIGHAIDYKYNQLIYMELHHKQIRAIATDTEEVKYANYPLERKADYFANTQKVKWV